MKCMFDTNVYITEDKTHFQIIKNRMPALKIEFM
jgi:hypothetical protein